MQSILTRSLWLTMIFSLVTSNILSQLELPAFERRIKQADTILFGRFNWMPLASDSNELDQVHLSRPNTYEFIVYCTIKKSKPPENVPHFLRVTFRDNETEMDMKKNNWFILFPTVIPLLNTWVIHNRTQAFDLEDDVELRIFEEFCFLKPKLPYGFPITGLLNRCPKPSAEHCLQNGTRIRHDELLELKSFLTSTTTRKSKLKILKRALKPKPKVKQHETFIQPVW